MLEARERDQARTWQGLRKTGTKLILFGMVTGAVIAMAVPSSRDLLISVARELPKQLSGDPEAPVAADNRMPTAKAAPQGPPSGDEMVRQATAIGAHASGGQVVDKKDLEFGMELMNFMTGPKQETPPAPPKQAAAPPAAPPKAAGVPGAKP
jgi:hypothetical protein